MFKFSFVRYGYFVTSCFACLDFWTISFLVDTIKRRPSFVSFGWAMLPNGEDQEKHKTVQSLFGIRNEGLDSSQKVHKDYHPYNGINVIYRRKKQSRK